MSTDKVITVRPKETYITRQQLPNFEGISVSTAGTQHLCMHLVIIPPGGQAVAHYHNGFETAIYIVKGRAETKYGEGLQHSSINEAGDFLFIPPNVPHQPVNLSETEEVIAVVARNDPNEQESVVLYHASSTTTLDETGGAYPARSLAPLSETGGAYPARSLAPLSETGGVYKAKENSTTELS